MRRTDDVQNRSVLDLLEEILANCRSIEEAFKELRTQLGEMPDSKFAIRLRKENEEALQWAADQVRKAEAAVLRERAKMN